MGLLRAPHSLFNLFKSLFWVKIKFTWFTLVYTGLHSFAPRCHAFGDEHASGGVKMQRVAAQAVLEAAGA